MVHCGEGRGLIPIFKESFASIDNIKHGASCDNSWRREAGRTLGELEAESC